jgi:hypothetical protein
VEGGVQEKGQKQEQKKRNEEGATALWICKWLVQRGQGDAVDAWRQHIGDVQQYPGLLPVLT